MQGQGARRGRGASGAAKKTRGPRDDEDDEDAAERAELLAAIEEAVTLDLTLEGAFDEVGVSVRTIERWRKTGAAMTAV